MRIGVYIPNTLPKLERTRLFQTIETKMSTADERAGTRGIDACILLDQDNGAPVNRTITQYDAVIFAQRLDSADKNADLRAMIETIKANYPQKLVALYYDLPAHGTATTLKASTVFNGMAKGADVVYAELPENPVTQEIDIDATSRKWAFRALVHAVRQGRMDRGIRSPELFTPNDSDLLSLGALIIDRNSSTIETLVERSGTHLLAGHSRMQAEYLAALAAYKGSYLPRDLLMQTVYNAPGQTVPNYKIVDVIRHKMNKIFNANGLTGGIQNLWGVGSFVKDSDFMFQPVVSGPTSPKNG